MQLLMIRHGQSLSNVSWVANGGRDLDADTDLSELGKVQAAALGKAFAEGCYPKPDVILTSLMARAVSTAAPIAAALDMEVTGVADVHEVGGVYKRIPSAGPFSGGEDLSSRGPLDDTDTDDGSQVMAAHGRSRTELLDLCPGLVLPESATEDGWYHKGIETHPQAWDRACRVASRLTREYGVSAPSASLPENAAVSGPTVALVCHFLFSQVLLRALMGWSPDLSEPLPSWYYLNNTGLTMTWIPNLQRATFEIRWLNRTDHLTQDQLTD
ncbi:MAG: phosphoglycerate mutase family protein [Propionibacteriaceae bacterium]|jgi:2,3-bisphosphoglycerate-dependent phosphoglycerate mutase|nr:phosphoglycerate mutase family protein [Propionibacteriaceae bacterium]